MKYDDASWHAQSEDGRRAMPGAGATHIGMFLAWAILNGLAAELDEIWREDVGVLKRREMTPGAWLIHFCDGKFNDAMLSVEGNAFAEAYYEDEGEYLRDYARRLGAGVGSLYDVPDTWETYDRLAPALDRRLAQWRGARA
ncbi:MAG TPA: hypothetical protein VG983_07545 [Caulobacterales bacterium]|nr:hypothetical protein [Caulobacterales bacterium]